MNKIECPQCGENDRIQKVSSIVSDGTTSGTFSGPTGGLALMDDDVGVVGGYSTLSGSSQSNLAQLLTPPPKPITRGGIGSEWIVWIFVEAVLLYLVFSIVSNLGDNNELVWSSLFIILLFALSIGIPVYAYRRDKKSKIQGDKKYFQDMKKWKNIINPWNRYYYCFRDDIIFDPETGKSCPPQQLYV